MTRPVGVDCALSPREAAALLTWYATIAARGSSADPGAAPFYVPPLVAGAMEAVGAGLVRWIESEPELPLQPPVTSETAELVPARPKRVRNRKRRADAAPAPEGSNVNPLPREAEVGPVREVAP